MEDSYFDKNIFHDKIKSLDVSATITLLLNVRLCAQIVCYDVNPVNRRKGTEKEKKNRAKRQIHSKRTY